MNNSFKQVKKIKIIHKKTLFIWMIVNNTQKI